VYSTSCPPAHYDDGSAPAQLDVRTHYRLQYYAVQDTAVNCIEERIKQPGLQLYVNTKQLLLDAANGQVSDDRLSSVCDFFREDVDREPLNSQLLLLPELCKRQSVTNIGELKSELVDLGLSVYMFSEVKTLLKLFYVIPGSSATAERSFSVMRHIKLPADNHDVSET